MSYSVGVTEISFSLTVTNDGTDPFSDHPLAEQVHQLFNVLDRALQ